MTYKWMNTLTLRRRGKSWELPLTLFVRGLRKARSGLLELQPTKGYIIDKTLCLLLMYIIWTRRKGRSLIVVLAPRSKKMTLKDSAHFSDSISLATILLQTLGQELIGRGKDLKPFWNDLCNELSARLWLPIVTECVGSPLISSRISSNFVMSNSLFSTMETMNPDPLLSSQMTSYLSSPSIPADKWVEEDTRVRKIRMYPTKAQASVLRQWMGTTRFIYNRTLNFIRENPDISSNFYSLKEMFVNNPDRSVVNEWELSTPSEVRRYAIKDLMTARAAAFTNLKKGNIAKFKLNFRSKKRGEASIGLPKKACKLMTVKKRRFITLYPTIMKKLFSDPKLDCQIRLSNDRALKTVIGDTIDRDIRVQRVDNRWYLCVPIVVKGKVSEATQDFCSMDPGTRKFQTIFANDRILQVNPDKMLLRKLEDKLRHMNRVRKKMKKSHYVRRVRKIHYRISNLVDSMHYGLRNELTSSYKTVFLPSFESQELVRKNRGDNFRREVLQFKHYRFKMRMLDKANLIEGCRVVICTEEYTSQTCSYPGCGKLTKVGGSEIFNCQFCGMEMDRDWNGSRGIGIKCLSGQVMSI